MKDMKTKLALNEAIQVGPWRVARKHLLFVIAFGLIIITFGVIILQTHVFDKGEEEDDEGDEEGDEEWGEFGERFSGGDWVMVAIMVAAGLISLVAASVCVLVKNNAPRRLSLTHRTPSVYSVQFNNDAKSPPASAAVPQSYSAPQQLPLWSGQIIQQQQQDPQQQQQQQQQQQPQPHSSRQQQNGQPILTLPQHVLRPPQAQRPTLLHAGTSPQHQHQPMLHQSSSQPNLKLSDTPPASAPQYDVETPPPYSP